MHQLQPLAQRKWLLAVAHSCVPCSVCCFQFNIPGSWTGTAQGERCFPMRSLPGRESFPRPQDGCRQGCALLPASAGKASGRSEDAHGGRGRSAPPHPRVPWELSLEWGLARQGQGTVPSWLVARGGCEPCHGSHGSRGSVRLAFLAVRMATALQPPGRSPGERGASGHPGATGGLCGGGGCSPAAPPVQRPPGRGGGEQPNAFQKISCKRPGRVIRIKLIKPLLVSRGRNPDVAVCLFWI